MVAKIARNAGVTFKATAVFMLLHLFFALFASYFTLLAKTHCLVIFFFGCWAALREKKLLVACVAAYIVGAEVFWRAVDGIIFWEFAKYQLVAIFGLAILTGRKRSKGVGSLILYFILLLPALLFMKGDSFFALRQAASFNLSGPISLLFSGLYFSRVSFSRDDLKKIFAWLIAPTVSLAFLAFVGIRAVDTAWLTLASSKLASAGFGPNQVSAALGLAAFFCLISVFLHRRNVLMKWFMILLGLWFFAQSLLTFSRGGVLQMVISAGVFYILMVRGKGGRLQVEVLVMGLVVSLIAFNYIIPKLEDVTGGSLSARYARRERLGDIEVIDTTGRTDLLLSEITLFRNNLLSGIGVGNVRASTGGHIPHTEWTRLLAEHGLFGLFAILLLFLWIVKSYKAARNPLAKALAGSFALNAVFFMFHAAMRTALPGFLIGFLGSKILDTGKISKHSMKEESKLEFNNTI